MVGTPRSSSRLATTSNADPALFSSTALVARSATELRSYPALKARPVPVSTSTLTAGSLSMRSNNFIRASRSSGCSRVRCRGRVRRMVARAPLSSNIGVLAASVASDIFVSILFIFQLPAFGFGVDGFGKIGMPRHQHAEIDEIKHQQLGHPRGRDIGGAQIVAEQCHLAEER